MNQRAIFQHWSAGDVSAAQAIEGDLLSSAQTGQFVLACRVQHSHGPVVDPRAFKAQKRRAAVQGGLFGNHPSDPQPLALVAPVGRGSVTGVGRQQDRSVHS